ncbi:MAG: LpqN/LpqT family lipoprotein [Segniliparus sp.]|uniref:LpqN/LpqT family lipoprotein n=1 Tax=Segniliparus sp. TaxID=2804064 RepID=UPI003F3FAB56
MITTVACAQTIRGRASLPQNNTDFVHDPQITNIGVDAPASTPKEQSAGGSGASGGTLGDYLRQNGVAIAPVPAGQGLTVTVPMPNGWKPSKPEGVSQQVAFELPAEGSDAVYAFMTVDVYQLSKTPPPEGLLASAKNSIAEAGNIQTSNDTPYQGNPSTVGIVTVTTKQGSRVVEILRFTFVQDPSSSTTYMTKSAIVCGTDNWQNMRDDLLGLDSGMSFGS